MQEVRSPIGSREVAKAALQLSMTFGREQEQQMRKVLSSQNISSAASDFGGDFLTGIVRMVERAVVAAKREKVIGEMHLEEGAVAGATREALSQVSVKAMGLSVGGKIGIARCGDHVAVAVFFSIGLGHLDEICVGLGHRAL